jgi:hypothetical protein
MFQIYDGRDCFYQWDLNRKLVIGDNSIREVHFCNRTDNCSLTRQTYTINGTHLVDVPDILLQTDWRINVYAFDGNYTKHSACFKVVSRTKPENYVFTDVEVKHWDDLEERINDIEAGRVPEETIVNAVNDYLKENPVQAGATAEQVEQIEANTAAIKELQENGVEVDLTNYATKKYVDDAISTIEIPEGTASSGLTTAMVNALDGLFKLAVYKADASTQYNAFCVAFGLSDSGEEPDIPDVPDVPVEPDVTLVSISATYNGDSVTLGTDVNILKTNLVVVAHYGDGTSKTVTNYTLTGIVSAVGENVITVTYENVTTTFVVIGYIEQNIPSDVVIPEGYELVRVLEADDIVYGVGNTGGIDKARASYPYATIPVNRGYTYRVDVEFNTTDEMWWGAVINPPTGLNGYNGFICDSGWITDGSLTWEVDIVETNEKIKDITKVAWLNPGFKRADNAPMTQEIKRVVISRKYIEGAITGGDEWETVRTIAASDIVYGTTNYGDSNPARASYPYLDIPVEAGYYYYVETEVEDGCVMHHGFNIVPQEGVTSYTQFLYDGGWSDVTIPIIVSVTADNTKITDISKVAWGVMAYQNQAGSTKVVEGSIKRTTIKRRKV